MQTLKQLTRIDDLEHERRSVFEKCLENGLVPQPGVGIYPEEGANVGVFTMLPTMSYVRTITRDPVPYLGAASKADRRRWTEEERLHADLYTLINRDFTGKKKRNVAQIARYMEELLEGRILGYLGPILLWFQTDDVVVSRHYLAARRDAYPHAIDGSTRLAAIHHLWRERPDLRGAMDRTHVSVIVLFGNKLDEEAAAQVFCDVNFKAIPVDPSIAKTHDKRDPHVWLVKTIERTIPVVRSHVVSRRQVRRTDNALFTRYGLYQTLRCFTDGLEALQKDFLSHELTPSSQDDVASKAIDFWRQLESQFGAAWQEQNEGETCFLAHEKYLHVHTPVLKAIAATARSAYFPVVDGAAKAELFAFLASVEWRRSHSGWKGILTRDGKHGPLVINSDPAVRELTRLLNERSSVLPRR